MAAKVMKIVEDGGKQLYTSDFTFAESITLLEIWKHKLINSKLGRQNKVVAKRSANSDKGGKP